MFHVQQMARDLVRELMGFAARFAQTVIGKAEHAVLNKAAGFSTDGRAVDASLLTTGSGGFRVEDARADEFVTFLERVGKEQLKLIKILPWGSRSLVTGHGLSSCLARTQSQDLQARVWRTQGNGGNYFPGMLGVM